jgi:hypothetical protein
LGRPLTAARGQLHANEIKKFLGYHFVMKKPLHMVGDTAPPPPRAARAVPLPRWRGGGKKDHRPGQTELRVELLHRCSVSFGSARRPPFMITVAHLQPLVALLAGILILIMPRLLNYIVAIYLIVVGITGLGLIH